jgi:hypothetical protein
LHRGTELARPTRTQRERRISHWLLMTLVDYFGCSRWPWARLAAIFIIQTPWYRRQGIE